MEQIRTAMSIWVCGSLHFHTDLEYYFRACVHFANMSAVFLYLTLADTEQHTLLSTSHPLSSSEKKRPISAFMPSPWGHVHSTWLAFDTARLRTLHSSLQSNLFKKKTPVILWGGRGLPCDGCKSTLIIFPLYVWMYWNVCCNNYWGAIKKTTCTA